MKELQAVFTYKYKFLFFSSVDCYKSKITLLKMCSIIIIVINYNQNIFN